MVEFNSVFKIIFNHFNLVIGYHLIGGEVLPALKVEPRATMDAEFKFSDTSWKDTQEYFDDMLEDLQEDIGAIRDEIKNLTKQEVYDLIEAELGHAIP